MLACGAAALFHQVFSRRSSTSSTSSNDSGTPVDLLDEPSLPPGASAGLFYANGATGYKVKPETSLLQVLVYSKLPEWCAYFPLICICILNTKYSIRTYLSSWLCMNVKIVSSSLFSVDSCT